MSVKNKQGPHYFVIAGKPNLSKQLINMSNSKQSQSLVTKFVDVSQQEVNEFKSIHKDVKNSQQLQFLKNMHLRSSSNIQSNVTQMSSSSVLMNPNATRQRFFSKDKLPPLQDQSKEDNRINLPRVKSQQQNKRAVSQNSLGNFLDKMQQNNIKNQQPRLLPNKNPLNSQHQKVPSLQFDKFQSKNLEKLTEDTNSRKFSVDHKALQVKNNNLRHSFFTGGSHKNSIANSEEKYDQQKQLKKLEASPPQISKSTEKFLQKLNSIKIEDKDTDKGDTNQNSLQKFFNQLASNMAKEDRKGSLDSRLQYIQNGFIQNFNNKNNDSNNTTMCSSDFQQNPSKSLKSKFLSNSQFSKSRNSLFKIQKLPENQQINDSDSENKQNLQSQFKTRNAESYLKNSSESNAKKNINWDQIVHTHEHTKNKEPHNEEKINNTENNNEELDSFDSVSSDFLCDICEEKPQNYIGRINCCTHTFCFTCISNWNIYKSQCPVCEKQFNTIEQIEEISSTPTLRLSKEKENINEQKQEKIEANDIISHNSTTIDNPSITKKKHKKQHQKTVISVISNDQILNVFYKCEVCFGKYNCNEQTKYIIDNQLYCKTCYHHKFKICFQCNKLTFEKLHKHDNQYYCFPCFSKIADRFCWICDQELHEKNKIDRLLQNGEKICNNCFIMNYCFFCMEEIQGIPFTQQKEGKICLTCYPKHFCCLCQTCIVSVSDENSSEYKKISHNFVFKYHEKQKKTFLYCKACHVKNFCKFCDKMLVVNSQIKKGYSTQEFICQSCYENKIINIQ